MNPKKRKKRLNRVKNEFVFIALWLILNHHVIGQYWKQPRFPAFQLKENGVNYVVKNNSLATHTTQLVLITAFGPTRVEKHIINFEVITHRRINSAPVSRARLFAASHSSVLNLQIALAQEYKSVAFE